MCIGAIYFDKISCFTIFHLIRIELYSLVMNKLVSVLYSLKVAMQLSISASVLTNCIFKMKNLTVRFILEEITTSISNLADN